MGQKINPVGFRLGVVRGWDSNWYGGNTFSEKLVEDHKIREYVQARIPKGGIAKVVIERTLKRITLTIHTARPGILIGRKGDAVKDMRTGLEKLTGKKVKVEVTEIDKPDLDATLVAENIVDQLQRRIGHSRAMKRAISQAMRAPL